MCPCGATMGGIMASRLMRQFEINMIVEDEGGEHENYYVTVQFDNGWRYSYRVSPHLKRYCFQQIIYGGMKAIEKLVKDGDIQPVGKSHIEMTTKLSKS